MDFIWQLIKAHKSTAIGIGGGLLAGATSGLFFGGGFSLMGIAAGLAGGALAAGAGYFIGNAIDERRHDGHDFTKTVPKAPVASKQTELTPERAEYAVKLTPDMWVKIRTEADRLGIKPEHKQALELAEKLSRTTQADFVGVQVGDIFTLKSISVEGYVEPISFEGKDVKLQIKDKAIDFSHPTSLVGFDKIVGAIYDQRTELFDKTRARMQPMIDIASKIPGISGVNNDPNEALDKMRKNLSQGDIKNPYANRTTDDISGVIGFDFIKDLAEKHGTDGLKTVLQNRLLRYADPAKKGNDGVTVFDAGKAAALAELITKEYRDHPGLRTMTPGQAHMHFHDKALSGEMPLLMDINKVEYAKDPKQPLEGDNRYSMLAYTLDLVRGMHQPISEGLRNRAGVTAAASLETPAPARDAPSVAILGDQFKSGTFDHLPLDTLQIPAKKDEPGAGITGP